ncbi:MAG: hypothetical protein QME46_08625 [Thermoanaerobacteraceae bacterium]|nr:hypothetical protein [Thermoanaerobacteraceae bacterium]
MKKIIFTIILLSVFLSSCGFQQVIDPKDIQSITVGLSYPYSVLLEKITDRERISTIANIINRDAKNSAKIVSEDYDMKMIMSDINTEEVIIERISPNTFLLRGTKDNAFKSEALEKYFTELKTGGIQKLKTNPPIVKFDILNYTKQDVDNIKINPPDEISEFFNIYNISDTVPEVRKECEEAITKKAKEEGLDMGDSLKVVSNKMHVEPYLPVYNVYADFNNKKAWIISVIYTEYPSLNNNLKDELEMNSKLKKIRSFVVTPDGKLLYSN